MRRLFFSLYIAVAAAFIAVIGGSIWLWENGLRNELLISAGQIAVGPQYLFEKELRNVPLDAWPAHLADLKRQFGYELALLRLDEVQASNENLQRLRQGLVALSESDEVQFMLLPMRGSDYVVRVHIVQSAHEDAQRGMRGFYYLLEKQLAPYTGIERTKLLQGLEKRFGFPLRSVALSEISDHKELDVLRSGEIVGRDVEGAGEQYFKLTQDGDRVLQIGPFPAPLIQTALNFGGWTMLAISVAIALYLWSRFLWHDMRALDQGALSFGLGKLDARVQVSARSPVRALANTFNGMAQRVQELMKSQKEMADAVSHELRTPISRLRFGVEMLGRTQAPGDYERYMQGIVRDIDELDHLVEESLTYSRLTNSQPRLSSQSVALSGWLEEIMQDARRSAGAIELSSEITPANAAADFDPVLMARALKNIIRNSLRYARTTVKVTVREEVDQLELTVEDDGPGVPIDRHQAIFEPFYRIDSSRQRESGGHGLGLAIVKRICEWHRAQVTVGTSALGGALFRLRLPVDTVG